MEQSETFDKVTRLGKLLVNELAMENSSDTLGRWMAHYIAGKMEEAANAAGEAKQDAEQVCADTILQLWNHRWKMNSGVQPIRSFQEIFQTLSAMVPANKQSYYYRYQDEDVTPTDNSQLNMARELDFAARTAIEYLMSEAATEVASADLPDWIEASESMEPNADILVIRTVYEKKEYASDSNTPLFDDSESSQFYLIRNLEETQKQLDLLMTHTKSIKSAISKKIKAIKTQKTKAKKGN